MLQPTFMSELIELFQELPTLGKIALMIGLITPLLVLNAFLNPPKTPPPPPPPKRMSVSGDVTIQEKPPIRK
jgi:hypothetical protein